MHKFIVDKVSSLIFLEMEGMISPSEAEQIVESLIDHIARARFSSYALIIDVTRCPVQNRDMIATMKRHLASMKNARAVGVIVGTKLAKLQVQRIFSQPYARVVASYEQALSWVVSGIDHDELRGLN